MNKGCLLLLLPLMLLTTPTYAYIDPGAGSMLLQMIIGSIATGVAIFMAYYQKIKLQCVAFFLKRKTKRNHNDLNEKDNNSDR